MEVIFAGVGEAFDENFTNTSILVTDGSGKRIRQVLLDCGFTAAHDFWRVSFAPMELDAVWVSHFHGDHFFGIPLLLLRFWEQQRKKPLTITGGAGIEEIIKNAMELAYPGFLSRIKYKLTFQEVSPGKDLDFLGFHWSFAENSHSRPCLAIRLENENGSIFYSGDGSPTDDTHILARGCDLIVHEAYGIKKMQAGHGRVDLCMDFAQKTRAKALALVHMNRDVRRTREKEVRKMLSQLEGIQAFLPQPGDRVRIESLRSAA